MTGPKTEGFSGSEFCFVVETLDNGTGKLSFGAKPVQQQGPVTPARRPGHLLHPYTAFRAVHAPRGITKIEQNRDLFHLDLDDRHAQALG
jgi:hypothetical protein